MTVIIISWLNFTLSFVLMTYSAAVFGNRLLYGQWQEILAACIRLEPRTLSKETLAMFMKFKSLFTLKCNLVLPNISFWSENFLGKHQLRKFSESIRNFFPAIFLPRTRVFGYIHWGRFRIHVCSVYLSVMVGRKQIKKIFSRTPTGEKKQFCISHSANSSEHKNFKECFVIRSS
jgi:hypothetical protein